MAFRTTSEPPTLGGPGQSLQGSADSLPLGNNGQNLASDSGSIDLPSNGAAPADDTSGADPGLMAAGWSQAQWTQAMQQSFQASEQWFQASVERGIARNYAHFQSRHAPGSKYLTEFYRLRSQTFRPKTRSMVRRDEAFMAVALFSTLDLLDTSAWDDTSPDQQDASEVGKALLQYRMERTLQWFLTCMGAIQEADVTGRVYSHVYWRYRSRERQELQTDLETGKIDWVTVQETIEDEPRIDLVPIENIRIDPAADWRDPLNRSPYLFHREPMYVGDIKALADDCNREYGSTWYFQIDDTTWWRAAQNTENPVRRARDAGQLDPLDMQRGVPDYEVVWVTHCYMRRNGTDYFFDMLDEDVMLCSPRPIEEVLPHLPAGIRPYVGGTAAIEAHKVIPTAPVGMLDETQREINEIASLTQDGLRIAVLHRWIARRGANIDMETLKYGAANSVILADDIGADVRELKATDVPQSAFAYGDRMNNVFDELAGNFSQASVVSQKNMNETVGGMEMLQGDAGAVKEYAIRTMVETWVDPVLNQLLMLEQTYETDQDLLHDVCTRTGLALNRVLDVLGRRVRIQVNVGFGATSPQQRIQRLQAGLQAITELLPEEAIHLNAEEIVKVVMGALGYKNGSRFWNPQNNAANPALMKLQQENMQLKAQMAGKQATASAHVQAAQLNANARLRHAAMDAQTRQQIAQMEMDLRAKELQLQAVDRQIAMQGVQIDQARLANERDALSNSIQVERQKLVAELAKIASGTRTGAQAQMQKDSSGPPFSVDNSASGELARDKYGLIPTDAE